MKKIFGLALIITFFSCSNKEGRSIEIQGTVKNTNAKMVYLEEVPFTGNNPVIIDSAQLKSDGSFDFKTTSKEESLYSLRTEQKLFPFALVISDASKVTVNADMNNQTEPYTVKGSDASEALMQFDRTISNKAVTIFQLGSKMDSLAKAKAPDTLTNAQYALVEAAATDLKNYAVDFLSKSNSPALTMYAIGSYQNITTNIGIKGLNETELSDIINKASEKFPKSVALQEAKKRLRPAKVSDLTLPDVNGNPISLSSFKGKYLLVDFWASWCNPCRRENPTVVKAFNQFKDKNFTVLGVSLDQKKEDWLQAIQTDGLTWTHVSDLKFWNSKAVELFHINSIPYNILLDPEGNIIGEDLHGEELIKILGTVLK